MAFHGADNIRAKIVVDFTVMEQVRNFEYLGCSVSYFANSDVKISYISPTMCAPPSGELKSTSTERYLKFYKVMALYDYENWTLKKSQASRMQATDARGRVGLCSPRP